MNTINFKTVQYFFILFISLIYNTSFAGTRAGTTITNQASIIFSQGSATGLVAISPPASFIVNEIIDVQINWIDSSQIPVSSPDYKKVLTFKLTNTGNGQQKYILNLNPNIGGGNFNPIPDTINIYIENNLQTGLQVSGAYIDTIYTAGNTITLEPSESKNIYLVYNIPSNLSLNYKGFTQIEAVSTTPGVANTTVAGTIITNADGSESLIGYTLGRSKSVGNYVVSNLQVTANKSVINVLDTLGGNIVQSQSILTYKILLNIEGIGEAKNIHIIDNLPVELDYIPNSMTLNDISLPDSGNVNQNNIDILVGDQIAPKSFILIFKAKVK